MKEQRRQEKKVSLNTCRAEEQCYVLAQITRNQYSLDYWIGALSMLPTMPVFKQRVKQLYNQIMREYERYNCECEAIFRPGEDGFNAHEILLDNASEFHSELKKTIFFYEQAMSRIIQQNNIQNAPFMMKMATAKDLLEISAVAQGQELCICPAIGNIGRMGGDCYELPYAGNMERPCRPTVMGHFTRLCGRLNLELLKAYGRKSDITYEMEDNDISRSMGICSTNLVKLFTNYELIYTMYEDHGHTADEAREILAERKAEKAEKDAREQEKQIKKEAKKAAKSSYQKTTNRSEG